MTNPTRDPCLDVCNLPAEDLKERQAMIRREIAPLVRHTEILETGYAFDFDANPETRSKLEQLVALERQCCGGLEWELEEDLPGGTLQLQVRGLEPGSEAHQAFARFGQEPAAAPSAPAPSGLGRMARAGGLGLGVSFFLFCMVPIGAAALFGAAAVAPLALLDDPRWIAGGALALALPAWLWMRRRHSAAC